MKNKQKKEKYIDDGHTIYDMNVEGMRGYREKKQTVGLSKKEKFACIKAALEVFLPKLLLVLFCFFITMVLIYFWLR